MHGPTCTFWANLTPSSLKQLGLARGMFAVMDTDGSGEISSKELQQNLSTLGLDLNEETAFEVVRRSGATEATSKEL